MSGRLAGAFVGLGLAFALATAGSSIVGAAKLATPPAGTVAPQQPIAPAASHASQQRNLLDTYCVTCHNARRRTANLLLDEADVGNVSLRAELWEKVVRKLQAGAMPPAGAPRPENAATQGFVTWLEGELDRAAAVRPQPGRPSIHRLNRVEYGNAIRDLLGLEIDSHSMLPADDAGYGFDNIADVLSVSPGLLERYMSAARRISQAAVGDPNIRPSIETYTAAKYLVQDARMDEQLPFGSRGGMAVRHNFPLDGEYVIKIRLQRTWRDEIRGIAEPHELEVRLDRERVKQFTIGGQGPRAIWARGQAVPDPTEYELNADSGLEVRLTATAGQHLVGVAFVKETVEEEGFLRPDLPVTSFEFAGNRDTEPAVDTIQIAGPYNTKGSGDTVSRRRIFVCEPARPKDEEACARRIIGGLARRAYRRPVTDADIQPLVQLYRSGRQKGRFEAGIELALRKILVSPEFLFRIEHDPDRIAPATAYRITDVELASRLSFFLWSSIPDEELLAVAERGELSNAPMLEKQVRRMIADQRASALVSNFAGQWLYVRNMRTHAPDPNAFPDFDDNLRLAFQRETELFIESQLRDDRNVLDLLSANYTFVNERLARHYGIPNVYGNHFRRVTLEGESRGGLLGQGSVLTVTSYPTRTSPVLRGKWLLENILGTPPPPPPPNVPSLKETGDSGKPASVRERMEIHRKDPVCASCHSRMDPLGFALENFDAIGRWRTADDGNTAIDPAGTLPDGTRFDGPAGLRQALLKRSDAFVRTLTEKLLTYALGRGLEYYDAPAVRKITHDASAAGDRWSAILVGIIKSTPFQMRLSQSTVEVDSRAERAQQP